MKIRKGYGELKSEVQNLTEENLNLRRTNDELQNKVSFIPEHIAQARKDGAKHIKDSISGLTLSFASKELDIEDALKKSYYEVVEENGSIYLVTGTCPKCNKKIAKKVESKREGAIFASILSTIGRRPSTDMVCFNCYEKHFDEETILKTK